MATTLSPNQQGYLQARRGSFSLNNEIGSKLVPPGPRLPPPLSPMAPPPLSPSLPLGSRPEPAGSPKEEQGRAHKDTQQVKPASKKLDIKAMEDHLESLKERLRSAQPLNLPHLPTPTPNNITSRPPPAPAHPGYSNLGLYNSGMQSYGQSPYMSMGPFGFGGMGAYGAYGPMGPLLGGYGMGGGMPNRWPSSYPQQPRYEPYPTQTLILTERPSVSEMPREDYADEMLQMQMQMYAEQLRERLSNNLEPQSPEGKVRLDEDSSDEEDMAARQRTRLKRRTMSLPAHFDVNRPFEDELSNLENRDVPVAPEPIRPHRAGSTSEEHADERDHQTDWGREPKSVDSQPSLMTIAKGAMSSVSAYRGSDDHEREEMTDSMPAANPAAHEYDADQGLTAPNLPPWARQRYRSAESDEPVPHESERYEAERHEREEHAVPRNDDTHLNGSADGDEHPPSYHSEPTHSNMVTWIDRAHESDSDLEHESDIKSYDQRGKSRSFESFTDFWDPGELGGLSRNDDQGYVPYTAEDLDSCLANLGIGLDSGQPRYSNYYE